MTTFTEPYLVNVDRRRNEVLASVRLKYSCGTNADERGINNR